MVRDGGFMLAWIGLADSSRNGNLLHFLPAFGAEFGPGGDRFPAVGTGCHCLCWGRCYEHGFSTVRAEPSSLLNAVSALGACDECSLGLH